MVVGVVPLRGRFRLRAGHQYDERGARIHAFEETGLRTRRSPSGASPSIDSPALGTMRKGMSCSAKPMARSIALPSTRCTTRQPSRISLITRSIARGGGHFAMVGWFDQTEDYFRDFGIVNYCVRRTQRVRCKRRQVARIAIAGSYEPH